MKTIAEVMMHLPIVVEVPGSRNDAINLMVREKLTGLPVVRASDGKLVGIVSRRDVFKNFKESQLSLIMKKDIITITPDKTIAEAAEIFTSKRIHRLPVVDDGKFVGIITPTDLLDEIIAMKTPMKAEDVLNVKCVTAYEKEPLSYTVPAMRISDVPAMPVLNDDGELVGILTDRDLFLDQGKDSEALSKLGLDEGYEKLAGYRNVMPLFYVATQKEIPKEYLVEDAMVRDPATVYKKTSLSDAAKIMKVNDFGQLPVHGNNDELIGMIYDIDVLYALVGKLDG